MTDPEKEIIAPEQITPEQETEALRAMRESYEQRLADKDKTIAALNAEHAKQIREILTSGADNSSSADQDEQEEEDPDAAAARKIADRIKKMRR